MHFGASERKEDHAIESSKRSQKKLHILNMSGILASKYKFLATLFFFNVCILLLIFSSCEFFILTWLPCPLVYTTKCLFSSFLHSMTHKFRPCWLRFPGEEHCWAHCASSHQVMVQLLVTHICTDYVM